MKKLTSFLGLLGLFALAVILCPAKAVVLAHDAGPRVLPFIGLGGLIVNAGTLQNIFTNLKATFNKAFEAAPSTWEKIAMKVTSTGSQNDYAWLENFPKMRRWVGDKVMKALKAGKYVLVNEDFEATVSVKRNHIEDDNLGIYGPQAQSAGFSAKQWPDELVMEKVNGAFTTVCFDGQYFCDTDHPGIDPVTGAAVSVSNKGTAALSCASLAAAQASLGAARTAMKKFRDDEGRPLNITPNVLLVPPALEDTASVLANNERLEDGKQNPYKGTFAVVCDARLTSDTAWFLLDTTKPVRPFIFQERKGANFVQQTDMSADDVFKRGEFNFGVEARGAAGYGFWQLCYGSTGQG
ncbi:Mu-like prophage major head subunit gpT family protein [Geobacter anodireducens]|uniref:Mu-like prophage major head subunit gpT family protein n=1 Tax=Geobacter anodireducens TaxID=1340425 RepID=A0ABR9NXF5_9BACT|nr:Mu-like prophage major head subunit gpT family protein [Geobacter anodireducens]MBE2888952.1 Mu-like prophage major head subunit gpT family protein [Geobacter anodireducens]